MSGVNKNIAEVGNTTSAMETNEFIYLENSHKRKNIHNSNCMTGYTVMCVSPTTMSISPSSYCVSPQTLY